MDIEVKHLQKFRIILAHIALHVHFLPGRLALISSMYSSIEVRALYPAQLMVPFGWRPRSCACDRDQRESNLLLHPGSQITKFGRLVYHVRGLSHCFALIEADGVAIRHGYKAVSPLPILLQILKQVS